MKRKPEIPQPGHSVEEFRSKFNPAPEVEHLRAVNAALQAKLDSAKKDLGEQRVMHVELMEAIQAAEPPKMAYKPNTKAGSPITHVLHLTDLHNGEVTRKDEVDGFGEFNPALFDARLQDLASRVIDVTAVKRSGYNIPTLHVIGTGDYISGDIHEELKVTNAYPAPVQCVRASFGIGAAIALMAPHFERVVCDFITLDNHGRLTRKNQASEGGENNFGYLVAHGLKQYLSRFPNVEMRIHAKPSTVIRIGSERYLAFHGHEIKGWAGLPYYGFDRRAAMEAVKRMNVPDSAFTKMVFGHFHVAVDTLLYNSGGSLSGTNAFDHSCGRHARAHQTSWFVHPTKGQFDFTRWWL